MFLTDRKARSSLAPVDVDPRSSRARLPDQLRHSGLTHAAEDGASTPMLMALSGHTSVRSLAK